MTGTQNARLHLPLLPTTTIGSFPQTAEMRKARAALRAGEIDDAEYDPPNAGRIADVDPLQEEIGLDVLVHGEFERNDMVEYFGEQLDGSSPYRERLGAVLRLPLRAPADHLRRRRAPAPDDGAWSPTPSP